MLPSSWVSCGPLSWKDFQILMSSYPGSKTFHSIIFNWSKVDLNIILVSGVQHSDLIFLCIMKWSPWCLVTICHHTKLLQYYWLYFLCHHHMWLIYFIIESLYLLICFACLAYPSTPYPLATISLISVSMNLFLFYYVCSFVFFFL